MNNFGILGWPLEKTFSPFIHKYLLDMTENDGNYEEFKIKNIAVSYTHLTLPTTSKV